MANLWIKLSFLFVLFTLSTCLTCWTRKCTNGDEWCHEQCQRETDVCIGLYFVFGPNNIVASQEFSCSPSEPDECLATRCDLSSTVGSFHLCCCREDFCNVVEGVDQGVTPLPQGTVATPSGTPPAVPNDNSTACESFSEVEHIYKSCSACTANYKFIAEVSEYQVNSKQCLSSVTECPGSSSSLSCELDTSGSAEEISCCCTGYLCNSYSQLSFTDITRVSDYVHQTQCDESNCTHSCVIIDNSPICLCQPGFLLLEDGSTCVDIDECETSPCSDSCINTDGSFRCACPNGYRLKNDGMSCEDAGLSCITAQGTAVAFCNDVRDSDDSSNAIPECQSIYQKTDNNNFILTLASCQWRGVENRCTNPDPTVCVLAPLNNAVHDDLFGCCCTGDLCNHEFTTVFPSFNTTPVVETPMTTTMTLNTSPNSTEIMPELTDSHFGLIAVGVIVAVLIIIIIFIPLTILFWWCYKKHKGVGLGYHLDAVSVHSVDGGQGQDVILLKEIGRGRFSTVHHARWRGQDVAVKCFYAKESFTREKLIYLSDNFSHQNILKFLTSVNVDSPRLDERKQWLVFEYHEQGSLYSLLHSGPQISLRRFCTLSESIAAGLAFLHSEKVRNGDIIIKPCVVHRDLKTKNILVKSDGDCVISDFGLSIRFPLSDQDGHGQVGTSRYMAPEVLEGCINFDRSAYKQIDCYALGIIIYEIMTRTSLNGEIVSPYQPPFSDIIQDNPSIQEMREWVVTRQYRPHIPDQFIKDGTLDMVTEMLTELWDSTPVARLTAQAASDRIKKFRMIKFSEEKGRDSGYENEMPSTPSSSLLASPYSQKSSGLSTSISCSGVTNETTV